MSNNARGRQLDVDIQIDDAVAGNLPEGTESLLRRAASATLENEAEEQAGGSYSLTILLTGDTELQRLNRDFLDLDQPTDVLSFPDGDLMPQGSTYLGDIAISVERAQQQASAGGHDLLDELQLLTIHGVLHLLGHDHAEEEEKRAMWSAQAAALAEIGLDGTWMNMDERG